MPLWEGRIWVIFHLSEERGGIGEDGGGKAGTLVSFQPLEASVLFSSAEEAAALLPTVQKPAST